MTNLLPLIHRVVPQRQGASSFLLRLLSTGLLITGAIYLPNAQSKLAFTLIAGSIGAAAHSRSRDESLLLAARELVETETLEGLQLQLEHSFKPANKVMQAEIVEALPAGEQLQLYNWDDVADEAVGFIIAGNSGSAKTSVACWLAGHLTKHKPAQILALDPHEKRNPLWRELGIKVIGEFAQIEEQINLLIELLDHRRGLDENGDEVIVFADELGACLSEFSDPKSMEKALKRLGSEARKYGITFLALNQSANVEDIGISAQLRNNYVLILLGAAARSYANRNWGKSDPRTAYIHSEAYPCILTGAVPASIAKHPTHGEYSQFKKKGNAPKNISAINQLPLTIPIAGEAVNEDDLIIDCIEKGWTNTKICTEIFGVAGGDKFSALSRKINQIRGE